MMTKTHLSIGEVLSLLSDDFPDLTITKIRFLESQGLIDPERTASGYRKFFDFDIDRLRWVLRQQRENFLPLKVIKDRLDESDGKILSDAATAAAPAQPELDLARDPGAADPPPVWMADHARVSHTKQATSTNRDAPVESPPASATTETPTPAKPTPAKPTPAKPTPKQPTSAEPTPKQPTSANSTPATPTPTTPDPKTPPRAEASGVGETPSSRPPSPPKEPEQPMPDAKSSKSPAPPKARKSDPAVTDVSDVSMTRDELLGASGLDESQLSQLESYGIVAAGDGPDSDLYGADALVCARHAATMFGSGLEARHLRAFKVAAEREAGLYEQLILPLLRQRNPSARSEAIQTVDQLSTAGAAIHAALLRRSLNRQLRTGH